MVGSGGHIILVAKLKGGSGATTAARELASAVAGEGKPVAVIDLDGQGSLSRWWNRRSKEGDTKGIDLLTIAAEDIPGKVKSLRRKYQLVVIDSPPSVHDTIRMVAGCADLTVVPSRPTVDDLDAVGPVVRLVRGVTDIGFVLSQIPPGGRSRDGADALAVLAALAPVFGRTTYRVDYPRAASIGSAAVETGGEAARAEIGEFWSTIRDRLSMTVAA